MQDDKYMNPNNKARWSFGGSRDKITVGDQTVGETGGVDHVRTEPENEGARFNGGGDEPKKRGRPAKQESEE